MSDYGIFNFYILTLTDNDYVSHIRRYFLWCLERFRQGQHPSEVAYDVKPKKKIRGWGARVQNGVRVRGMKRPGEK